MAEIKRTSKGFELRLDAEELALINNALNQALELPSSEFRTLMGAPKKAADALLERIGEALSR